MARKGIDHVMNIQSEAPLFAAERKQAILHRLRKQSKITVAELCEAFHVSPVTIRGDLRELESDGALKRTHGGAITAGKASFEAVSSFKETEHLEEKCRIAANAELLIEDGDTIVLDTGTTTLELAKRIVNKRNLTVVTNDLKIASYLETYSEDSNIIMVGGLLRRGFHCTVGAMAADALANLNADKAFMATNAYSPEKGFTTPSIDQAEIKKLLMRISSEVIILMDSSKVGKVSFVKFADCSNIDKLICDDQLDPHVFNALKETDESLDLSVVLC